jgi:hypothetical protein
VEGVKVKRRRSKSGIVELQEAHIEARHSIRVLLIDRGTRVIVSAMKIAAVVYCIHEEHALIVKLAEGKIDWSLVLSAILSGDLAEVLLAAITVISIVVALSERRIRKTLVEQMSSYIRSLEDSVDKNRSRSGSSADGKPSPEDIYVD